MLKVFTDINFLTKENRSRVFPLIFDLVYADESDLTNYFTIQDKIENSDIAIWPLEYDFTVKNYKTKFEDFNKKAKQANKIIWIYTGGDFGYTLKDNEMYNFRLGGFRSKINERTIVIPSFVSDPYRNNLNKPFRPLIKEELQKIGFVGHAKSGLFKYLKEYINYLKININRLAGKFKGDYQTFYPSSIKRAKYLNILKKSMMMDTDFIFRDKYRAGAKSQTEKENSTREFFTNIYSNPYTFCLRGVGNFSVRFFETLAVGRIPVLIDTDCNLPLQDEINWEKHCIKIPENDINKMDQIISNFHKKLNSNEFINFQKDNRNLWESKLTRDRFFIRIHDKFIDKISQI
jgi:hypothetical protein